MRGAQWCLQRPRCLQHVALRGVHTARRAMHGARCLTNGPRRGVGASRNAANASPRRTFVPRDHAIGPHSLVHVRVRSVMARQMRATAPSYDAEVRHWPPSAPHSQVLGVHRRAIAQHRHPMTVTRVAIRPRCETSCARRCVNGAHQVQPGEPWSADHPHSAARAPPSPMDGATRCWRVVLGFVNAARGLADRARRSPSLRHSVVENERGVAADAPRALDGAMWVVHTFPCRRSVVRAGAFVLPSDAMLLLDLVDARCDGANVRRSFVLGRRGCPARPTSCAIAPASDAVRRRCYLHVRRGCGDEPHRRMNGAYRRMNGVHRRMNGAHRCVNGAHSPDQRMPRVMQRVPRRLHGPCRGRYATGGAAKRRRCPCWCRWSLASRPRPNHASLATRVNS